MSRFQPSGAACWRLVGVPPPGAISKPGLEIEISAKLRPAVANRASTL